MVFLVALVVVAAVVLVPADATCNTCLATFCGTSSECDTIAGCYCNYDTWSCAGSR